MRHWLRSGFAQPVEMLTTCPKGQKRFAMIQCHQGTPAKEEDSHV